MNQIAVIHQLGWITSFEDFDNDGYLDLVGSAPDSTDPFKTNWMRISKNMGNNVYKEIYKRDATKELPVWAGDSDHDGLKEMLFVNIPHSDLWMWESIDNTKLPVPPIDHWQQDSLGRIKWHITGYSMGNTLRDEFHVEDLTGDGINELFYTEEDTNTHTMFVNIWSLPKNKTVVPLAKLKLGNTAGDIITGDFDGDGKKEIIVGGVRGYLQVFEYEAKDSFASLGSIPMPLYNCEGGGRLENFRENGKDQFIFGGSIPWEGVVIYVMFEAIADNQYAEVWRDTVYDFPWGTPYFRNADVDGDGKKELIVYTEDKTRIYKYYGKNDIRCVWKTEGGWSIRTIDLNKNGKAEVMFGWGYDTQDEHILIYEFDKLSHVGNAQTPFVAQSFSLKQNYPNPFNSSTQIEFITLQREGVEVTIFDLLGNEVKKLFVGTLHEGTHMLPWDGKDEEGKYVSTGVYLYRVIAGGRIQTKPMLLLR